MDATIGLFTDPLDAVRQLVTEAKTDISFHATQWNICKSMHLTHLIKTHMTKQHYPTHLIHFTNLIQTAISPWHGGAPPTQILLGSFGASVTSVCDAPTKMYELCKLY